MGRVFIDGGGGRGGPLYTRAGRHESAVTQCPLLNSVNFIVSYNGSYPVVMVTADTLRATTREKVRRVIFAFYRNLLEKPCPSTTDHFGVQMVTYKVLLVSRRSHDCHMIPAESHTLFIMLLHLTLCREVESNVVLCQMTMCCHMTVT